jgi:predicted P-loop ATPase
LTRDVDPDEYQAIGRRVAASLGIDKFDDTSYQPQRMMYWPSTSLDGEYMFEYIDAPFLDPDAMLATYHDWRDISSWPMSSRVADVQKKTASKQKDPLEKGGLVGAFCRAYNIREAIETYVPSYQPCDEPNRYTYTEGSTAAGVVVYDDKFTYSHHATDPAAMQLCNAWDLVRLHQFHELDADFDPDKPITSRPSYKAMTQLAANDERVKVQLVNDRTAEATIDFDTPIDESQPDDWKKRLKITEKGALAQTIENVVLILENDPNLAGCLALNEMEHNIVIKRDLPWRKIRGVSQWVDADDAALRYYLERIYGLSGKDRIFDAVNVVAQQAAFHPVKEYLEACTWDEVPRVETLLIDYLGAEDDVYTRTVTRKTLAAAVARIYRPGCKFDYMLTLRGKQGIGKSALIAKLGGPWFSDTFTTMQGKEAYEQVIGVWLMEVGELAGMRKAEAETIKLYVSKQTDRFRPAYGRRLQEFPRQCIFIGTTNESQFLRDTTGNRRFWVIDTPNKPRLSLWDDLTPEMVRLIWAEAVHIYKSGEDLFLPPNIEKIAREVQESYAEENPRAGIIADYLDRLLPADWESKDLYSRRAFLESGTNGTIERTTVCALEIWAEVLNGNPEKFDRYAIKEIRDILAQMPEWQSQGRTQKTIKPYGRQRYFERKKTE